MIHRNFSMTDEKECMNIFSKIKIMQAILSDHDEAILRVIGASVRRKSKIWRGEQLTP